MLNVWYILNDIYHEFRPTVGKYSSPMDGMGIGKYIHTLIRHGMGMVAPPTL